MDFLVFEGFYNAGDDGVGCFFVGADGYANFWIAVPGKEYPLTELVIGGVNGDGGVFVKHVVLKSPHKILTEAVEKELPNLEFTPGIHAGKPIKVWVTIPFDFRLQ